MRTATIGTLVLLATLPACEAPPLQGAATTTANPDERWLDHHSGWTASVIYEDVGVGVWGISSHQVFTQYGSPEVVTLDEAGRCQVLIGSAGRWQPVSALEDGEWLASMAQVDVDPRIEGPELYVAGERGNVYQVVGHKSGSLDARLVAELHGYEVHALVGGMIDPSYAGNALLAFTNPGGLCLLRPNSARSAFDVEWLQELPGRVRDALVLPTFGGGTPWIATVSRAGRVELLRLGEGGPEWQLVHAEAANASAIALRPLALGPEAVLYTTRDDGRVLRHARDIQGQWQAEIIFAGAPGPRGLISGRFTDDPGAECLALYGHAGEVVLLEFGPDGWFSEVIFRDVDRGYRLALAELDGRNGTPEILCAGWSGRVVLLSRPAGYGLRGVLTPTSGPTPVTEEP